MSEPVSVVITCYNLEEYIQTAVQSVISQDYAGEVEIIIVDDHSTDGSRSILRTLTGIVTVLQDENGGVMNAMISGLRVATHDVVFFLDGDDLWHPSKLSRCMAVNPHSEEIKLWTHDLWYMDPEGRPYPQISRVSEVLSHTPTNERGAAISRCILNHLDYVWLGSAFGIRRSSAAVNDFIAFCEERSYLETCYQDWPLAVWVALIPRGEIAYVDEKLFGYRLHNNNYSGSTQTLEKLQRNLRKSLDTIRLIDEMMTEKSNASEGLEATRRIKMTYELLLAAAEGPRGNLLQVFLCNFTAIRLDRSGLKTLSKVGLALLLGPRMAYGIVEISKRKSVAL